MEELLTRLETFSLAQFLRTARWTYAAINAGHVLGIALLVGSILPLDLKLLGLWPKVAREALVRVLVPVAIFGLVLAVTMGALLFSVRATEYAALGVFQLKLALVATGATAAITLHARHGFLLERASPSTLRAHGLLSMFCWLGALACGRLIAFSAP